MLILAGITINALTGSNSAPDKAGEATQKNDIGKAQDQIGIMVLNAKTDAYVSSTESINSIGKAVIKDVAEKIQANNKVGSVTIEITGFGTNSNITDDATITITTIDYKLEGTITFRDGVLTWGEIEDKP